MMALIFLFQTNAFKFWYDILYHFFPIITSISMYLMMEHNTKHYIRLLTLIHWVYIHWICCKYRHMVTDQLEELKHIDLIKMSTSSKTASYSDHSSNKDDNNNEETEKDKSLDTTIVDIICDEQMHPASGNELSVETMTHAHL